MTTFKPITTTDPETGREVTQLTHGDAFCYPPYYFGEVITNDARTTLFHRYADSQVQMWKLDIPSGEATQLTFATGKECLWRAWDQPEQATGVREHYSGFCQETRELFYFDDNQLRCVHIDTMADRLVYDVPADRVPCGLPGVSPDGRHFIVLHADRDWWESATVEGPPKRHEARGVKLDVVDTKSGACRNLVTINSWLTHANFYDNQRIIFANPATEGGLLLTDLGGKFYMNLRPQTETGWIINHKVATKRGIMYETVSPGDFGVIGICDPDTYQYHDYMADHPIHHIGRDPEGRLWFGDYYRMDRLAERVLGWLPELKPGERNTFQPLTRGMTLHGDPHNQRTHVHASVTPDRKHILFTGPDDESKTNHLFLLDISDLMHEESHVIRETMEA